MYCILFMFAPNVDQLRRTNKKIDEYSFQIKIVTCNYYNNSITS